MASSPITTAPYTCDYVDPDKGRCEVFQFDNVDELADHLDSGKHVFPSDWTSVTAALAEHLQQPMVAHGDGNGTGKPRTTYGIGWSKCGDVWAVRIPNEGRLPKAGESVTFEKRNGGEATVVLGEILRDDLFYTWFAPAAKAAPKTDGAPAVRPNKFGAKCAGCGGWVGEGLGALTKEAGKWTTRHIGDCPEATAKVTSEDPPEGIHLLGDTIYKVQEARNGSGNLYAKELMVTPDTSTVSGYIGDWEYIGRRGAFRQLSEDTLCTMEEAAAFGHLYGICGCCGADLTNELSIERGIGPVCYGKHFG